MKVTAIQAKYYHISRKNYKRNKWFFIQSRKSIRKGQYRRHYGPITAMRLFVERNNGHIVYHKRNRFRPLV